MLSSCKLFIKNDRLKMYHYFSLKKRIALVTEQEKIKQVF
ncbi:hypothetical protein X781_22830 [Mannheimia sp. USDA-ARS-USMARC-1261]|nr:hypothetical protein X781_22830 [Mannheimia sp. USDA-ARS-USMARC-1261]